MVKEKQNRRPDPVFSIIHEALHLGYGFSDQAIAEAISKGSKYFSRDKKGKAAASKYWDAKLRNNCSPMVMTTTVTTTIR